MSSKIFISTLCCQLLAMLLFAQPQIEAIQKFSFNEGLSDRAVRHVTRDSRGFIWIATDNGLNRYTGHEFEIYNNTSEHPFFIHENQIRQVEEIEGDKLILLNNRKTPFFETFDLENFESKVFELDETNGIRGNIKAIYPERHGKVYVLTDFADTFSIYEINGNLETKLLADIQPAEKAPSGFMRLQKCKAGYFWIIGENNGLIKYSPEEKSHEQIPISEIHRLTTPSATSYATSILHQDKKGRLWIAFPFRNGLFNLLPDSGKLELAKGFHHDQLYSNLWEDITGQLMIGTFTTFGKIERLYFVDADDIVSDAQWLLDIDNKVNHIFAYDFQSIVVLSTITGISKIKLEDRKIKWVLADQQLEDGDWDNGISIRSITGDGAGNIYITRELKAWYRLQTSDTNVEQLNVRNPDGEPVRLWCNSNAVYDPNGYLWGGSCADDRGGLLHRFDLKKEVTVTFPIPNKVITHIVRDGSGELLLASGADDADGLLLFFDPETEELSEYLNSDGTNPFVGKKPQYISIGSEGTIWVGTNEGLVAIDRNKKTSRLFNKAQKQISNDNILVIHENEQGRLMLGSTGGLSIFDKNAGEIELYNTSDGLCNNTVCGIVAIGDGNYFLSTYYGLSYFDPEQGLFSNFYKEKGLTFNEFNRLAFYKDVNDNYYFGTLNGINVFRKEDITGNYDPSYPIQWIRLFKMDNDGNREERNMNLSNLQKITMKHGDDYYWLEFSLPNYSKSEDNKYAVLLEGRDTSWNLLNNSPTYVLNRPPPGNYLLRIKASPALGVWYDKELQLEVEVREAFYQRPWFQIGLPLFIIILSYLISTWVIGRIKKREERQTLINKKFAELELQALQSQMNPHFVFNALGAIQFFIQKNNVSAADSYLAKFAKLMRLFLESSKNKYISMAEEIKLLSLYVDLEKMRFEDKFDYQITVDEKLDVHFRELPSILIQPFIENAINHGLFHKRENGFLNIHFKLNDRNGLTCVIEDNGVGRKKAREFKEQSRPTHKSRGMQLVNERLEVLQQVDEIDIVIKVEDIYPDQEETGTVVTIELPDLD